MRYRDFMISEKSKANKQLKKDAVKRYNNSDEEILKLYDGKTENLYASYTVVNKVGINPRSGYNTPVGIYAYPMEYVIEQIKYNDIVPYMGDAPYIQIFSARNPERALDLETYNSSDFKEDLAKIREYFVVTRQIAQEQEFEEIVERGIESAYDNANPVAAKIWNVTRLLSEEVSNGNLKESKFTQGTDLLYQDLLEWNDSKANRSVVVWNGIFRNILGYDFAVDKAGMGVIHTAEPTQAVFFSKQALQVVNQIKNNNEVIYQLGLINKIGQDNPGDPKSQARKSYEYQKLIAQNLNNPSVLDYQLKNYYQYVTSPKLQRKLVQKNPAAIIEIAKGGNSINDQIKQQVKNNILKTIKTQNSRKIFKMLSLFESPSVRVDEFFDIINSGAAWPELELAIVSTLDKSSSTELINFAEDYVIKVKKQPWPEFEEYISSSKLPDYIISTGAKFSPLEIGDLVKINSNFSLKDVIAKVVNRSNNKLTYSVQDTQTNKHLGSYEINELEKIQDADVEPKIEPTKSEVKKTKGPTGPKIGKFVAKAQARGGDITQAELDQFLPPGTIKSDSLKNILELLRDSGITVDGKPIDIQSDTPEIPATHSAQFKPYDGEQKLTTKEQNAWEQIMIKSFNDDVVKPLLTKAFKKRSLNSQEFYTLAKNIDFPFWVAGKYLGNAGVKVDTAKAKQELDQPT